MHHAEDDGAPPARCTMSDSIDSQSPLGKMHLAYFDWCICLIFFAGLGLNIPTAGWPGLDRSARQATGLF